MSLRARDGLEQAADHAVLIYVDPLCSGNLRETGHSHYITGKSNDKACACAYLQIAHSDREVLGCAQLLGVIGEGILCFGHADRELVKAQLCQLLALLDGGADELYAVCVVDLGADRIQLIHDGKVEFVGLAEIIGKFAEADNFFCQCFAAFAMIENGLGMTITNNLITEGFQADIVKIPVDPPQYIRFGIMIPNKEALSPAARKFVQYAKRILTEIA